VLYRIANSITSTVCQNKSKGVQPSCTPYKKVKKIFMPVNKNALFRYSIIDSCLQRTQRKWFFDDLLQEINMAYEEAYGTGRCISRRSLYGDIANMKEGGTSGYEAPIDFTLEKGYFYRKRGYSIFDSPIKISDLPVLQQVLSNLRQLLGLGLTEELNELVQRLEYRLSRSSPTIAPNIIQFEAVPTYTGLPWLEPLYQAIRHQVAVELHYQPFHALNPQISVVHPHLLKQFNQRWFLLGIKDGQLKHSTFALDRIQKISSVDATDYLPITIDPEAYFERIIGSSVPEGREIEDIQLWFSATRWPYIRTKPLHKSQTILKASSSGTVVCLNLIPTRELITLLLSFGSDVRVLKPLSMQQEIQACLKESLAAYNLLNTSIDQG
jgi:predicted DNA-binding transcriptional regulator YafY